MVVSSLNNLFSLVFWTLLISSGVQTNVRAASGSQPLTQQQWLVGLTAVVGFFFLVFAILIIQRLFRSDRSATYAREGSRNAWFNRMMALSQPGYSAEKDPGLILVFFYQR
uniref:Uncharacterized protein n=1 Tax=Mola mola TaxID=94237 RepID=A0A3Q3WQ45_MOLML